MYPFALLFVYGDVVTSLRTVHYWHLWGVLIRPYTWGYVNNIVIWPTRNPSSLSPPIYRSLFILSGKRFNRFDSLPGTIPRLDYSRQTIKWLRTNLIRSAILYEPETQSLRKMDEYRCSILEIRVCGYNIAGLWRRTNWVQIMFGENNTLGIIK